MKYDLPINIIPLHFQKKNSETAIVNIYVLWVKTVKSS
jgi:hypothetical protein